MLPVFRDEECPRDPIRGWRIGICGYGNQGRAQALNLRDSGCDVVVIAAAKRPSAAQATRDGFALTDPARAASEVDLIAMLAPDERHRAIIEELAQGTDGTERLRAWVFAHGFALIFDEPEWRPEWDVFVVAPAGPGAQLRTRYEAGGGIPALMAVHRDSSGAASGRARAYAGAIGCARAGVLETTVRDEVEVDLFGEQSVLCGGMNALTRAAFETLVEAGYAEEMAYLECVHQLRLTAELLEQYGVRGMRGRISGTARFGDLTRGPRVIGPESRAALREILAEVGDGRFAREWLAARDAGSVSRPEDGSGDPRADAEGAGSRPEEEIPGSDSRGEPPDLGDEAMERAGERIRALFRKPEP